MEYLFNRYYKLIGVWTGSFLNNIPRSENIVQDFFIRRWEKEKKRAFDPNTFKSFLYSSIHNLAIDRIKKKSVSKYFLFTQLYGYCHKPFVYLHLSPFVSLRLFRLKKEHSAE